jgi:signal transduction histidine kinase
VLGYAELLCAGDLGALMSEQSRAVTAIAVRAGQLRRLLDQLNVLLEASLGQNAPQTLDLTTLVTDVARHWRCLKPDYTLEMRLRPGVGLNGDPVQLSQALDCLLDNAFKFTPTGGRIEVSLDTLHEFNAPPLSEVEREHTQSTWVYLSVSDSGIGISERDIMCLLDGRLFYQADGGLNRCHTGCGLGLMLVKAVARLHGGWLEANRSQPL